MNEIPEGIIKYPVLVNLDGGGSASGFFLNDKEGPIYFVTAKHVLFKVNESSSLTLRSNKADLFAYTTAPGYQEQVKLELQLDLLYRSDLITSHSTKDVSVIKFGVTKRVDDNLQVDLTAGARFMRKSPEGKPIMSVDVEMNTKKYAEVLISNNIFIFGYPSSIGIKDMPQIDYDKPLLRKGIIAGKNEKLGTIILDCPVYYGNSGGPVVQVERPSFNKVEYRVIGVVSEFVPFEERWYNVQYKYTNLNIENSGYSVATPMDPILELIQKANKTVPGTRGTS